MVFDDEDEDDEDDDDDDDNDDNDDNDDDDVVVDDVSGSVTSTNGALASDACLFLNLMVSMFDVA